MEPRLSFGVGVDRVDYTKGIRSGSAASSDSWMTILSNGKFSLRAGSRPDPLTIRRYQDLSDRRRVRGNRINSRFGTRQWKPIIFLQAAPQPPGNQTLLPPSDFCLVTSLHDGMNLVAKEYVASRDDEGGAVILSKFTGAAQELEDALLVNPYDAEEVAEAIRQAVEMDPAERTLRMKRMRQIVREKNIFRWAADLVSATADIRLDRTSSTVKNNVTPFPVATIR